MVTFTVAFASIAIYFSIYIQEEERGKAYGDTLKLFTNIAHDIDAIESNLVQQTYFIDTEESILASIYFINTYEHSSDYEPPLIDEEKKSIAQALLERAKFAFNDTIVLYGLDSSVVAGVQRGKKDYIKFISTYEKNRRIYKSTHENGSNNLYTLNEAITQKYHTKHKIFYDDTPHIKPQITLNLEKTTLLITAHHSLFEGNSTTAHIEISKRFDKSLLKVYRANTPLKFTTQKSLEEFATPIEQLENIKIVTTSNDYRAALKITTLDGNLYIALSYPKINLWHIIQEGSNDFFTVLITIAVLFIVVMYLFYHTVLIGPLDTLMHNIERIKHREFKALRTLRSHDELEEIATHIDHLASSVQNKEQELQYIAQHDWLTNLYNRYHFNSIINEQIRNIPQGEFLALVFIDIDEFKSINDTLGHDVGDHLLIAVSQRLKEFIPPHGNLSRIGGDEFMIVLPKIHSQKELVAFAHRLHKLFEKPFDIQDHYLTITISSGIVLSNDPNKNATMLYKEADIALYKSKERGKDRFTLYKEEFACEVNERNAILNGLKEAITDNFSEFYLHYQPKIATMDSKTVNGIEALVRWESQKLGYLPPDRFIAIAEESGVIIELGYWIIERSCRDLLRLQQEGIELLQVSINISAIQFASKDFLTRIKAIIAQTQINPKHIEFELTERIIAQDDCQILTLLNALKDLGIHLAIDDFGTGYSSLSYLRKLPVDRLKIDKSFVTDIDKGEAYEIVQSAIVPLAKALHLFTTAEGVERQGEFEVLKSIGVDDIQGFYFAKPMSIEKLKNYLKSSQI